MRSAWGWTVAVSVGVGVCLAGPRGAEAQAIAFAPTVATIPDGVSLNAIPVVSADRRYVRLSVNPSFQVVNSIQSFPIPFAVSGLGSGGGAGGGGAGGAGGGAGGLLGTAMGMNGPAGGVAGASGQPMMNTSQPWAGAYSADGLDPTEDWSWSPPARRPKATRSKSVRAKKSAPIASTAPSKPSR